MEKSVYLDSTILSYLYDERESIRNYIEATKEWWQDEREFYDLYISGETIAELNEGDYVNKEKVLNLLFSIQVLPPDEQIFTIANVYIKNYLMPRNLEGDSIHLAYASFYKMDFLLTWNCNHLANANKKKHIQIINTQLGLFTPEIITPLQLFREK